MVFSTTMGHRLPLSFTSALSKPIKSSTFNYDLLFKRAIFRRSNSTTVSQVSLGNKETLLKRLPVPTLRSTLDKYLRTVKPLVTAEEYSAAERSTREFENGPAKELQALLEEKSKCEENWLSNWWLQHAYLGNRMPLPIHSSPGMIGPVQNFQGQTEQLKFAAKMIAGILDYKIKIDHKTVAQDFQGKIPLDMSQYYKIFSTSRIADFPSDSLVHYNEGECPPRHICVTHNNHFFKVLVYDDEGKPLSESHILSQLHLVIKQSNHQTHPIGILTTADRNTWAGAYKRLLENDLNCKSLKYIEQSMFIVCLDGKVMKSPGLNKETSAALQMIHGFGAKSGNTGNRWFDKTLQFIVGQDGEFGVVLEHSPAEGPPVAGIIDHIVSHVERSAGGNLMQFPSVPEPIRLEFELSKGTLEDISMACSEFEKMTNDINLTCFTFDMYGKEFIKAQKFSPDSYIQTAMQLAFYKMHGCVGATYESASTRQFLYGRTEVIRSASLESLEFCKAMDDSSSSDAHIASALRKAVDGHKSYTVQAMNGLGVDRHLLGLKLIALENGEDVPDFFREKGFVTSSHFRISSSQVPTKCNAVMVYGPLVTNGYGCCYNPQRNSVNFGLSASNSCPETNTESFMNALQESLTSMHDVFVRTPRSKL